MHYKLVLQNHVDGLTQSEWSVLPPSTLGREEDCALFVDHESISRRHCQFYLGLDEELIVKDLESLNGTYVDDLRIDQATLMPGQTVQVGACVFTIEFSTSPVESIAPSKPSTVKKLPRETQAMETFTPVPLREEKPWWKKLFS